MEDEMEEFLRNEIEEYSRYLDNFFSFLRTIRRQRANMGVPPIGLHNISSTLQVLLQRQRQARPQDNLQVVPIPPNSHPPNGIILPRHMQTPHEMDWDQFTIHFFWIFYNEYQSRRRRIPRMHGRVQEELMMNPVYHQYFLQVQRTYSIATALRTLFNFIRIENVDDGSAVMNVVRNANTRSHQIEASRMIHEIPEIEENDDSENLEPSSVTGSSINTSADPTSSGNPEVVEHDTQRGEGAGPSSCVRDTFKNIYPPSERQNDYVAPIDPNMPSTSGMSRKVGPAKESPKPDSDSDDDMSYSVYLKKPYSAPSSDDEDDF